MSGVPPWWCSIDTLLKNMEAQTGLLCKYYSNTFPLQTSFCPSRRSGVGASKLIGIGSGPDPFRGFGYGPYEATATFSGAWTLQTYSVSNHLLQIYDWFPRVSFGSRRIGPNRPH